MKEFRVTLANRPGELAKLASLLGNEGVNIETTSGIAFGENSVITLIVDDETKTRDLLSKNGFAFEEKGALIVEVLDRPGELGNLLSKLAEKGINIESDYLLSKGEGKAQLVLTVDDLGKAKEILS